MKIGIIYCGYNTEEYISETIKPWIEAKKFFNLKISAVSVPFEEYFSLQQVNDKTTEILKNLLEKKEIDSLFTEPKYIKENIARNFCLNYLLNYNPEFIMLVDSDEFYTIEQIKNIFKFVEENKDINCFEINLKNYILDGKCWSDGFHPPRIFRNNVNDGIAGFYWDNDLIYKNGKNHNSNKIIIPKTVAHIKHMTWLNGEKSKLKVQYHMKHFGGCSYKWNEENKSLEIDWEYYDKMGYERPIINYEN